MDISPLTPWGFLTLELRRRLARARMAPDRGSSAIEWVIITGILVLIAGIVGVVIYNLVKTQAAAIKMPAIGGP